MIGKRIGRFNVLIFVFVLAVVLALATGTLHAGAPDPSGEIAWRYVTTDCSTGGEALRGFLALQGLDQSEALLADLLVNGPGDGRISAHGEAIGRRWDRRQEFLADDPQTGLSPELLAAIAAESREEYVAVEIARFTGNVRERAASALAAIGSDVALDLLDQIRAQGDEQLGQTVDRALEQFADGNSLRTWSRSPSERGQRRSRVVR